MATIGQKAPPGTDQTNNVKPTILSKRKEWDLRKVTAINDNYDKSLLKQVTTYVP